MTVAAPDGLAQRLVRLNEIDRRHFLDHQLRQAVAGVKDVLVVPGVEESDHHLTPVVGVNRAGAVENDDPGLGAQATARPDLRFPAGVQLNMHTGVNAPAVEGLDDAAFVGEKVKASVVLMRSLRHSRVWLEKHFEFGVHWAPFYGYGLAGRIARLSLL